MTATSSTHAEYVAAYHATAECLWIRSFLTEPGSIKPFKSTTLYCDNQAAIKIANNLKLQDQSTLISNTTLLAKK